jgi:hypothetical protein
MAKTAIVMICANSADKIKLNIVLLVLRKANNIIEGYYINKMLPLRVSQVFYFRLRRGGIVLAICLLLCILSTFIPDSTNQTLSSEHCSYSSACTLSSLATSPGQWRFVSTEGNVRVYTRDLPGTSLTSFRGVALLDIHISEALGPFTNLSLSYRWIDMLTHIRAYEIEAGGDDQGQEQPEAAAAGGSFLWFNKKASSSSSTHPVPDDIVHQKLSLPWPISPRELVSWSSFVNSLHCLVRVSESE